MLRFGKKDYLCFIVLDIADQQSIFLSTIYLRVDTYGLCLDL